MRFTTFIFLLFSSFIHAHSYAQADTIAGLKKLPVKYVKQVDDKIEKYGSRIHNKTEKTLAKLSRWENKIQSLLTKANPAAAERLFGNGQATFNSALQKIREGKRFAENSKAGYDQYRDKLQSSLKYIETQKDLSARQIQSATATAKKMENLEEDVADNEEVQKFIKERKDRLIDESIKQLGKNKYLVKMNKEAYYYAQALRNYKNIFSDPKKAEETALQLLNKMPAFQQFAEKNSPLAGLFASSSSFSGLSAGGTTPVVNGLPSRASLQQYMQVNMPTLSKANPVQQLQSKLTDIKPQLDNLKKSAGGMDGMKNKSLKDFKPNSQRGKTFGQRLEYGTDLQFGKSNNFLPVTTDIAAKIGYKLNDKSSAGLGLNYKMGMGRSWNKIKLSSEGLGLRTYLKWKLKKGFDVQGGSEWNYILGFKSLEQLRIMSAWQQSALIGLSKNYAAGKKVKGNIQVLYDFLYSKHPGSQPLVFRFGYGF